MSKLESALNVLKTLSILVQQFDMIPFSRKTIVLLVVLFPFSLCAQVNSIHWLKTMDPGETINNIHTIGTEAEVNVSDGLRYDVNTVFHDKQRAIFQRVYEDRTVTQGVEGRDAWTFEGDTQTEADEVVKGIVLGHQMHAQILFFDKFHTSMTSPEHADFDGTKCLILSSQNEINIWNFYYQEVGFPLGMEIIREGEANIIFRFKQWKSLADMQLPFLIEIDDGERQFSYNFKNIRINEGSLNEYRAPYSDLTEEQKLIRLHRIVMDDHLFGRTEGIKKSQADTMLIVSEGEVYTVEGNQPDGGIDRIMASRDYTVYDDLIRPIVRISDDHSLGWVIVQVFAKGVRFDENGDPTGPLEFTCSWIELYEKIDGDWKMKGNVSNFKPGRK